MNKLGILRTVSFGQRVAEEELNDLASYFVETDQWKRVYQGHTDIVYGAKGTGKSAIYALLASRATELLARNVIVAPAENPRGAPVFKDLILDPPTTETEFIGLWKLYFASIAAGLLYDRKLGQEHTARLIDALAREGLFAGKKDLRTTLAAAFEYAKRALRPASLEAGLQMDPVTSLPKGFTGKIAFQQPSPAGAREGIVSVDGLLELANNALRESGFSLWLLLDRLDVAFDESAPLEQNALRALFRVYRDLSALENVRLKIFLRSDIWQKITQSGFREASHITRSTNLTWDRTSLLNLFARRAVANPDLLAFYGLTPQEVLRSILSQHRFFDRMFPPKVDLGPKRPSTLDWMLGRTCDGSRQTAPREFLHLLNTLRDVQIRKLEAGDAPPEGEHLFDRSAFREALAEVSRARVEQTLFAENPTLRKYLEALRREKTAHKVDTLSRIWKCDPAEASSVAEQLREAGFFEQRGSGSSPLYWIPFLFRDALELVQGEAE